jgi:cystathionine beta-synthase
VKFSKSILDLIGNTPIVRLNRIGANSPHKMYAKLEFLNPGGSIKDRMVKYIVDAAESRGLLEKGSEVVENSSGNTGAALSLISAIKGYRCTITIPDKMSQEKINKMKAYGAHVVVAPTAVPAASPESYYSVARRIAEERKAFYPDQYNNPDNIEAHYRTTGPEIWEQCGGDVDVVVAGIGTGGTISGVGRYLKEKKPQITVIGVDPEGSVFYDAFKSGVLPDPKTYHVEGIGEDYLVKAVDFRVIDDIVRTNDAESLTMTRRLAKEEGILAGTSSGAALVGALKYASTLGGVKTILVIFPDSGTSYLSKCFNDSWMTEHGFL